MKLRISAKSFSMVVGVSVFASQSLAADPGQNPAMKLQGKVILAKPRTNCEPIFREKAFVAFYCPVGTSMEDIVLEMERLASNGWGDFNADMYTNRDWAPKSFKEAMMIKDGYLSHSMTVSITAGKSDVIWCFKNEKKKKGCRGKLGE